MEVAQSQYTPVPAYYPPQASQDASYRSGYIWFNIIIAIGLILTFTLQRTVAAPIAAIWCLFLIFTLEKRFSACIPLLFLAACYERPVLDFGLGIFATIKLFDIVALAVVVTSWRLPQSQRKKPIHDNIFMLSLLIIMIAVVSSLVVFVFFYGSRFELARLSVYYALKMVEYGLVLNAVRSAIIRRTDIIRGLHFFILGLSVVALIGILQGMGIVSNWYYTSHTGGRSFIASSWAISVLGPNHTHLGTYSALGAFLSVMLMQMRFRLVLLIPLILCMGSLIFSHSATGIAMLAFLIGTSLAFSSFGNKLILVAAGVVVLISMAIYFSGKISGKITGESKSAERSQKRLRLIGEDGIIWRAFVRPSAMISDAISKDPVGIPFGYGFRSPRAFIPSLPNMGDNNYMATLIDVGIVGFVAYLGCLAAFYRKLKSAIRQSSADKFMSIYAKSAVMFFWAVVFAMFAQEILWPAHSRGSTFPIFLIFMSLPFFYYESQAGANNSYHRSTTGYATF